MTLHSVVCSYSKYSLE